MKAARITLRSPPLWKANRIEAINAIEAKASIVECNPKHESIVAELKAKGIEYRAGQFPFIVNGRARAIGETAGFVKMLADAKTDRILGVHMIGPYASELISEAVVAMEFGASSEDIARIVHAHPTLAEALHEAALAVDKRTINL